MEEMPMFASREGRDGRPALSRFGLRKSAAVIGAVGIGAVVMFGSAGVAGAAVTTNLVYSTDNGATWTTSPTAAAGQTVLVREWYDNTDTAAHGGESLTTSIPAGFSLVPSSTKVCTSPLSSDPTAPNSG
jgi:hypothetical protein